MCAAICRKRKSETAIEKSRPEKCSGLTKISRSIMAAGSIKKSRSCLTEANQYRSNDASRRKDQQPWPQGYLRRELLALVRIGLPESKAAADFDLMD